MPAEPVSQTVTKRVDSEVDLIQHYLAPLAAGNPGALSLSDDCAVLACPSGEELVLTTDAVAEGVHFISGEEPGSIAWKALAVNVSDLAGKGARPLVYLMALSFPEAPDENWMAGFALGLAAAQERFGIRLAGGDTDRRPGPITVTITAIGSVPKGKMVRRGTARPGDRLFVSGTLGDAALGLALRLDSQKTRDWGLTPDEARHLSRRYERPEPRIELAASLRACASAAMDISDGLAKDLAAMCRASGVAARVRGRDVPLSPAARKIVSLEPDRFEDVVAGGEDYEVLAAVAPEKCAEFIAMAQANGIPVTEIGYVETGKGVRFEGLDGTLLALTRLGWDHFSGAAGGASNRAGAGLHPAPENITVPGA